MKYRDAFSGYPDGIYLDSLTKGLQPDISIEAQIDFLRWGSILRAGLHRYNRRSVELYEESKTIISDFMGISTDNLAITNEIEGTWYNLIKSVFNAYNGKLFSHIADGHAIQVPVIKSGITTIWIDDDTMYEMIDDLMKEGDLLIISDMSPVEGIKRDIYRLTKSVHSKGGMIAVDYSRSIVQHDNELNMVDFAIIDTSVDMLGPMNTTLLYIRDIIPAYATGFRGIHTIRNKKLDLIDSIDQFEPGIANISGSIAVSKNIEFFNEIGFNNIISHRINLHSILINSLRSSKFRIIALDRKIENSHIFSLNFGAISSHDVSLMLDEISGIMVRSGMGCTHMALQKYNIDDVLQFSTHIYNTTDEIDRFVRELINILAMLKN